MAAIGVLMVGFGALTAWAGLDKTIVFDIFRAMVGATPPQRTAEGQVQTASAITAAFESGAGSTSSAAANAAAGNSPNFNPNTVQ